jgi:hypothetical protein
MKAAVVGRWKAETDDRVRLALVHAAESNKMLGDLAELPAKLPIVAATRTRDVLTIRWADLDARTNLMLKSARLTARRPGEADRVLDLMDKPSSYSNGRTGSFTTRIGFTPAFSPGEVTLELSLVLEDLNKHRPADARTLALGTMQVERRDASGPEQRTAARRDLHAIDIDIDAGPDDDPDSSAPLRLRLHPPPRALAPPRERCPRPAPAPRTPPPRAPLAEPVRLSRAVPIPVLQRRQPRTTRRSPPPERASRRIADPVSIFCTRCGEKSRVRPARCYG